ncbi:hypothetical protein ANO11243_093790 [Dothideomycetidae sp. 11243]|nr:hypothetical protein ANO11243_093790 [fungal sp. No.11243]
MHLALINLFAALAVAAHVKTSTPSLATCKKNPDLVTQLTKHVTDPEFFCNFYLARGCFRDETQSALPGQTAAQLVQSCQCLLLQKGASVPSASSSSISTRQPTYKCDTAAQALVQKAFSYTPALCKYYQASGRTDSPIKGIGANKAHSGCACFDAVGDTSSTGVKMTSSMTTMATSTTKTPTSKMTTTTTTSTTTITTTTTTTTTTSTIFNPCAGNMPQTTAYVASDTSMAANYSATWTQWRNSTSGVYNRYYIGHTTFTSTLPATEALSSCAGAVMAQQTDPSSPMDFDVFYWNASKWYCFSSPANRGLDAHLETTEADVLCHWSFREQNMVKLS